MSATDQAWDAYTRIAAGIADLLNATGPLPESHRLAQVVDEPLAEVAAALRRLGPQPPPTYRYLLVRSGLPPWRLVPGAQFAASPLDEQGLRVVQVPVARFEKQRREAASVNCAHDGIAYASVDAAVSGYDTTGPQSP